MKRMSLELQHKWSLFFMINHNLKHILRSKFRFKYENKFLSNENLLQKYKPLHWHLDTRNQAGCNGEGRICFSWTINIIGTN